jgi:protein-S-isoprenylcysteine O-methyltransferase Ste14
VKERLHWRNIPIPQAHVVGLVVGILLQLLLPMRVFPHAWIGHAAGWPLVLAGIALALWAALEAGERDISSPDRLITSGPYALSRNPMYVGWHLIFLGLACIANSIWLAALFAPVACIIHFVDIRREERSLAREFGDSYREYRQCVRRYL